ncbi:MAG TPA: PadR family transcriptional regulator [Verrucomicrobiae bacterium]|nr:PadR family transcriptional regulator [Verrucomicrobiae bacterium]
MGMIERTMLHGNAETLVLALLAGKSQHGYQLRKELAARSRDYFQFAFGRLYPLLRSLEKRRLVTSRIVEPGRHHERRIFTVTAKGRAELRLRKQKWQQFSAAMNRVLKA